MESDVLSGASDVENVNITIQSINIFQKMPNKMIKMPGILLVKETSLKKKEFLKIIFVSLDKIDAY